MNLFLIRFFFCLLFPVVFRSRARAMRKVYYSNAPGKIFGHIELLQFKRISFLFAHTATQFKMKWLFVCSFQTMIIMMVERVECTWCCLFFGRKIASSWESERVKEKIVSVIKLYLKSHSVCSLLKFNVEQFMKKTQRPLLPVSHTHTTWEWNKWK